MNEQAVNPEDTSPLLKKTDQNKQIAPLTQVLNHSFRIDAKIIRCRQKTRSKTNLTGTFSG